MLHRGIIGVHYELIYFLSFGTVGFEDLSLRASGHVMVEVKSCEEVIDLTLAAWENMSNRVFQAAWVTCGYFDWEHMSFFDQTGQVRPDWKLEEAQQELSDLFGCCGTHFSPQRCVRYEWQIQEPLLYMLMELHSPELTKPDSSV